MIELLSDYRRNLRTYSQNVFPMSILICVCGVRLLVTGYYRWSMRKRFRFVHLPTSTIQSSELIECRRFLKPNKSAYSSIIYLKWAYLSFADTENRYIVMWLRTDWTDCLWNASKSIVMIKSWNFEQSISRTLQAKALSTLNGNGCFRTLCWDPSNLLIRDINAILN